ncbi:hypothetical protein OG909_25930 [Streptomyces sp. NBC_01754]|uniref:hypothetical protein n=1 Tax=Streptomyces sp. NBC_01754 TaxID=2975930 RepID=UPI002DDB7C24|nr:hypothetical protein [Streptomyces sp. NBC_01754]WSC95450.1 hypothetical protein OG909_25930 [Streptomyces sp. NBC_01754]
MEQRIDSNTQPEFAAGTDPAFIPGLTAPVPVRTEVQPKKAPEGSGERPEASEAPADGSDDVPPAATGESGVEASTDAEEAGEAPDGHPEEEGEGPEGEGEASREGSGPVFEVSDRRGSIRVNHEGVRFRLDDQEAEFDWPEIGAVEVETARLGRRFTVTVHLTSRRWFNAEVEAPARSALKQWAAELDEALDAYFEEEA